MRVKLFSMYQLPAAELNLSGLEEEINAWLAQNSHVRIVDVKQSATGGSLAPSLWLVTVWYEEATGRPTGPAEYVESVRPGTTSGPDPGHP